ncbi:MBL fold metallo-hydrolase RNA specificity domain-containing protein [Rufibacter quisquiliarum]|uniref:Metallo-beta-lactamase family protein n=1 Tax=Rufibacter quisquiliarum TaxID=1549639 RepID=A0A839GKL7_9BACT|nr:MBL fold metallo-hydrolase [Rufibacter quisquiliarum]MBA9079392.1 metallo-beta-lactamase family protein [Rufibacter quisquiliarum]
MTISFYGAAQSVTGSKHLITLENGKRILLDCGLTQGMGAQTDERNSAFDFEPENLTCVILSHAHIDHSGLLPKLVRDGYTGPIYCTPPTLELCRLLLPDSARIQESNKGSDTDSPLYSEEDAEQALQQFQTVPYDKRFQVDEDIELLFTDTGHVLGSAAINLRLKDNGRERTLTFSGDIGRFNNRILNAPQEFPQAEIILCESTYGNRVHDSIENTEDRLEKIVQEVCVERQGKLIIPAFSIGRTQELVYSLNYLAEEGRLPKDVKVFVDSPLSVYATDVMRDHPQHFNETMQAYIKEDPDPFGFPQLHFITEVDDSKELVQFDEPCVIISSSGMMNAGRIQHHLKGNLSDPNSAVLITGYCEPSTLGGKLMNGADKVFIHGEEVAVQAQMIVMKEYSAHGDYGDIAKFLHCQDKEKIQRIFLVHGEVSTMEQLKSDLEEMGYGNVEIPEFRLSYVV